MRRLSSRELLEQFVPRQVRALIAALTEGATAEKTERPIAVLFLDIEGCTRLCEDLPPWEMNAVFETYFSEYLDAVRGAGGEVTEVLGDGLVALFEGPVLKGNAVTAFNAVLEIHTRTRRLNARRGPRHDPVTVNLGLNAGVAFTGVTRLRGRSGERWCYSATGPVTNVAARLCALATRGQILTTKAVADLLPSGRPCRPRGLHVLKNVTGPVEVVEILPASASAQSELKAKELRHG